MGCAGNSADHGNPLPESIAMAEQQKRPPILPLGYQKPVRVSGRTLQTMAGVLIGGAIPTTQPADRSALPAPSATAEQGCCANGPLPLTEARLRAANTCLYEDCDNRGAVITLTMFLAGSVGIACVGVFALVTLWVASTVAQALWSLAVNNTPLAALVSSFEYVVAWSKAAPGALTVACALVALITAAGVAAHYLPHRRTKSVDQQAGLEQ